MYGIDSLDDNKKILLIDNLWDEGKEMWDIVGKSFQKYKKVWQNEPDWLVEVPRKRSKCRDNRTFLAVESVISTLTGRPSKPNVIPIVENDESKQISNDLQDVFLAKYRDLGMKAKLRRALRFLFMSKFMCLKVVWDKQKNDFDTIVVDSRNIRVSKRCSSMFDTEYAIELVKDVSLRKFIGIFAEKKDNILKRIGYTEEDILTRPMSVEYYEAWIDGKVIYKWNDIILGIEPHPYWDWNGIKSTTQELIGVRKNEKNAIKSISDQQDGRSEGTYESYFYNYFDRPIPPYVFGTVLAVDNPTVGETSLMEQVQPLQEEIDRRKRQISDNTEMMNGQYKIDTDYAKITKADAQAAKADPRGIWFGPGVSRGVEIMTGKDIPATVFDEMNHSISELDNIFGTQNTFRGEGGEKETATGRAILREQSFARLDELIDLIDNIHLQIYSWWYQMMRVRYTETHYIKTVGLNIAKRIIELTRNDIYDGMEVQVIPGQIVPQDRLYRAERAKEEVMEGIIDPLTYFEETERDNPQELAKRVYMYKANPLAVLNFTPEEMQKLQEGMGKEEKPPSTSISFKDLPPEGQMQLAEKAGIKIEQGATNVQDTEAIKQRIKKITESEAFKKLSPEEQTATIQKIQSQIQGISQ